jgi:hypothetical protein
MPGQTEMARGRLAKRLIASYAIMAVIGVAVVVYVVDKGGNEKAQPSIAGGYVVAAANKCVWPVPEAGPGIPRRRRRPPPDLRSTSCSPDSS